jgi:hypothetical protein
LRAEILETSDNSELLLGSALMWSFEKSPRSPCCPDDLTFSSAA